MSVLCILVDEGVQPFRDDGAGKDTGVMNILCYEENVTFELKLCD